MCGEVSYELSPAQGWGGGKALSKEEATEWMRRLRENVDTLCFEAVGVSVDDLRGVEWLNGVGRTARGGCVIPDMQCEDDVKSIRGIMEDPKCLWLQVDVSGGGWASDDAPVVVEDGYVSVRAGDLLGAGECGEVALLHAPPPAPAVALPLREVARDLGLSLGNDDNEYDSDVEMKSSPLALRIARRLGRLGGRSAKPAVESVVLFPGVRALPVERGRPVREGTVPDSVDGDDSEDDGGLGDTGVLKMNDSACGGGSGDGRCVCSYETELWHLNGKVKKL